VLDGLEGEKKAIIVNLSGAREAMRPRLLAVGLFLSVLLVNSRQLIEHMKRVWRIRGVVEANPLQADEGRKFTLEFSEEGDMQHVIRGGPWQYRGDVFLVEMLHPGADPCCGTLHSCTNLGLVQRDPFLSPHEEDGALARR
jgi:cytochrome c